MLLYDADTVTNDDAEDDLNGVGKNDLKASDNGHSWWRFKLDCPDQAVLRGVNMKMRMGVMMDARIIDHLLYKAKNANEDCENPFPCRHCKPWLVQCYLDVILSGNTQNNNLGTLASHIHYAFHIQIAHQSNGATDGCS